MRGHTCSKFADTKTPLGMAAIPPERLRLMVLRMEAGEARRRYGAALVALLAEEEEQRRQRLRRRRRRWWVKPYLQRRMLHGQYDTLMQELMRECQGDFKDFMRMPPDMFLELCHRVGPRIAKNTQ